MFETNRSPAWYRDAKWLSGVLLVVAAAAATLAFSLAQLASSERALPVLERVLSLTLLPQGAQAGAVAVRQDAGYQAGEPLELLPGVDVRADATELPTFTVAQARSRIAGVLADRVVTGGAPAALELAAGSELEPQLRRALAGTASQLLRFRLESALLPAGLGNGTRLADWPLQAQRNPGAPVQPIVGVFVRVPPSELADLSPRGIGERVVAGLSEVVLASGLPGAREQVANANLERILVETVEGPVRASLHELFETLLLSRSEVLGERLAQAQAVAAGEEDPAGELFGLVTPEELQGRTPEEANALLIGRLAERGYRSGGEALLSVVTEPEQAERLAAVTRLVDALAAEAAARYQRWAWFFGTAALVFLALLAAFSRGWGRLVNPGLALALAASVGALSSTRLAAVQERLGAVPPPSSLNAQGAFGYLTQLLGYLSASLPQGFVEVFVRNHLALLVLGAVLVSLSLVARLLQAVRPRRRSLL